MQIEVKDAFFEDKKMSTALLVTKAGASANVTSPAAPRHIGLPRTHSIQRLFSVTVPQFIINILFYRYVKAKTVGRTSFL